MLGGRGGSAEGTPTPSSMAFDPEVRDHACHSWVPFVTVCVSESSLKCCDFFFLSIKT